jgi:IBR domain, a half RING-finger domain
VSDTCPSSRRHTWLIRRRVECVICMSDIPSTKAAKLKCGHRMCNTCLKRSFKLSITDPQLMPPKCCTTDYIPLKHVDRLFDVAFKKTWNKKFVEFSTRNRLYCPSKRCGEFIKPEHIHKDDSGRKFGRCGRCKTKVCGTCNLKWHTSKDCPKDEETNKFLEQAKKEGWRRCYRCRSMVELKEGCNHMTW